MRRLLINIALIAASIVAVPSVAQAQDEPQHGGALTANRMAAHVYREGSVTNATTNVVEHHCPEVHDLITAWNESQDLPYYANHYTMWQSKIEAMFEWIVAEGLTVPFDGKDVEWCTVNHEDGWKVATDVIVQQVANPEDLVLIAINGETVYCSYGDVMMASATYYYNYRTGTFDSGFGTNWTEFPGPGVLWSTDIEFRCMDIFNPGTDVAEVVEAVPTTQVNANPSIKGLTGLDMWLWYDFSSPDSWQLGPYDATTIWAANTAWQVTAYAWIDKISWDVDCTSACDYKGMADSFNSSGYEFVLDFEDSASQPAPSYYAGFEADDEAAFEHIYELMGDYTLSTAAQWRGWYFVTSIPDGDVGPLNYYDPVVVAESFSLPVVSVNTELITGP